MLNLERLRVLHIVHTAGSITGAARALHVTASAVSQQLTRLEREVGQRLLEPRGRGVRLTEAGLLLAVEAVGLLGHVERVEADLAAHRLTVAGPLRIAAFATAVRGIVAGAAADLRAGHPELALSVSELEPPEAIAVLRIGDLDVAVVQDWPDRELSVPAELSRRHLADDVFDLAVPASHPLATGRPLSLDDLATQTWITWTDGQLCHGWFTGVLAGRPAAGRLGHTAAEHSTQLALVAAGLGIAVVPRLGREPVTSAVVLVPLDPPPVRRIHALWRTGATNRPAIRAALDTLTAHARQPTGGGQPDRSA